MQLQGSFILGARLLLFVGGHSRARMCLMIHIQQSLLRDVGVDLSCRQFTMTEQFLHASEVGPAVEQVGGEAVSQRVRARCIHQPAVQQVCLEQSADAPRASAEIRAG